MASSFNWTDALNFNYNPGALAGTSTPGSSGASSDLFGSVLQNTTGQATMSPSNPQDNFARLGLSPEDVAKMSPLEKMTATAALSNMSRSDMYEDPNRLRELMGVYGEFRQKEAKEAARIGLQRQAFQALTDIPKTIASVYALKPQMYLAGRQVGGFGSIPRRVSFE
jgi:hypothetical protein